MIYVQREVQNDKGQTVIHLVISTSCCKSHKFFIETGAGTYIDAETEEVINAGWSKTINMYRRQYKRETSQ